MFQVLVPVDHDEERAVRAAETVALLPNAAEEIQVAILNVEKETEIRDDTVVKSEDWYDENDFPSSVKRAKEVLEQAGISVTARREHADPAEAIVAVAKEGEADQIVMSGRKKSPTGKVLFGSVTQSVLLHADVPVTVVMQPVAGR